MRRPRILQPVRRPPAPRRTELSDYPIAFAVVDQEGICRSEGSIARNELHRLMGRARELDRWALSSIGLHGLTRLDACQARGVWADLKALRRLGEPIDSALLDVIAQAAQDLPVRS